MEDRPEDGGRRFLDVKCKTDRRKKDPQHTIALEWQEPGKQGWAKHGLEESEPAAESFHGALAAFAPWVKSRVAAALNVDPAKTEAAIRILGVAYQYSDDGSYKVTLSATLEVPGQGTPLVLNFTQIVPEKQLRLLLEELEGEASAYIDGERGQLQMELSHTEEGMDVDPPVDEDDLEV